MTRWLTIVGIKTIRSLWRERQDYRLERSLFKDVFMFMRMMKFIINEKEKGLTERNENRDKGFREKNNSKKETLKFGLKNQSPSQRKNLTSSSHNLSKNQLKIKA